MYLAQLPFAFSTVVSFLGRWPPIGAPGACSHLAKASVAGAVASSFHVLALGRMRAYVCYSSFCG